MFKKLFLSLMVASCAILIASAEDLVLKSGMDYSVWGPSGMKYKRAAADGLFKVTVSENTCEKEQFSNLQIFFNYAGGLKSGVKYQTSFTLKSSVDLKVGCSISLGAAPWSGFAWKTINLKAGEAQNITLIYTPKEDIGKTVRVPLITCGLAKAGTEIEVSNTKFVEVK